MPTARSVRDAVRLLTKLEAQLLPVFVVPMWQSWRRVQVGVELGKRIAESLLRVDGFAAPAIAYSVTEAASYCAQARRRRVCVGVVYPLDHAVSAYDTPAFDFALGSVGSQFDLDEQQGLVKALVRGRGHELPNTAVVESTILCRDGLENVGVPIISL